MNTYLYSQEVGPRFMTKNHPQKHSKMTYLTVDGLKKATGGVHPRRDLIELPMAGDETSRIQFALFILALTEMQKLNPIEKENSFYSARRLDFARL